MSEQRVQGWPGFMKPSRAPRVQKNVFHTIYHVMDARGVFEDNPANAGSRDDQGQPLYVGPVQYPKMFYHPHGDERVVVQAEILEKPGGRVQEVGEKREIIWTLARNVEEEERLRSEGWHDHPAKAIEEATKNPNSKWYKKTPPPMGADTKIRGLEDEVARLKRQLEEAQALAAVAARRPAPKKDDSLGL